MRVYQLEHGYWQGERDPSGFRIGFYTSMEKALSVRAMYLSLPGFIDHPEGFQIKHHIINCNSAKSAWVVDLGFDEFFDEFIQVGVFASKEAADEYVEYYTSLSGDDVKQGFFHFGEYKLDKSSWNSDFATVPCGEGQLDLVTPH